MIMAEPWSVLTRVVVLSLLATTPKFAVLCSEIYHAFQLMRLTKPTPHVSIKAKFREFLTLYMFTASSLRICHSWQHMVAAISGLELPRVAELGRPVTLRVVAEGPAHNDHLIQSVLVAVHRLTLTLNVIVTN